MGVRNDVELLRVVSAFGIVWFHSGYNFARDAAYAGLVVFLVFSIYFALISTKKHSIRSRASRLLIPCVIWSAIYAVTDVLRGEPPFPDGGSVLSQLLSTPSIHLWYLPFVFFWLIALDRVKAVNPQVLAVAAASSACALLMTAPLWRQWEYSSPFGQYMHATPAVLLGVLLSLYSYCSSLQKRILLAGVVTCVGVTLMMNIPGISLTYGLGFCASLILLKNKDLLPGNRVVIVFSKLTFGIYLVHLLILDVMRHLGVSGFSLPVLTFFVSAVFIYLMLMVVPKSLSRYLA